MRSLVAVLLVSVAGCSVPSYSLRSSSTTLLASNDPPGMVAVPASEVARRPLVLVPAVRRGHSITWTTGAIITFASLGVTLAGAGLTIGGLSGANFETGRGGDPSMMIAGIVISAIGDGGAFIGGPITWMAGIGGPRD